MRSFGPAAMQPRRRGGEPNGENAHARPAQIARHAGAMTGAGHSGEAALFPSLAGRWAHRALTAGTAAVLFAMMVLMALVTTVATTPVLQMLGTGAGYGAMQYNPPAVDA